MRKYGLGASTLVGLGLSLLVLQACGNDGAQDDASGDATDVITTHAAQEAAPSLDGPDDSSACVAPVTASAKPKGTGKYGVVVETNSAPGIKDAVIFRPADLKGPDRFPIYVWGEGGCIRKGLNEQAPNAEIASQGYLVIADGTLTGAGNRPLGGADAGKPLLTYIDWAVKENNKPCSPYYHKLDITKIASNGFSCGGIMAQGTAADPRLTTWMINSSGGFSADQKLYKATHGPVLIVLGGSKDIAYTNGKRDYENLSKLKWPIMLFSWNTSNHGGDLTNGTGNFNKINLAWLNWWLKGDEGPTGKGFLVGPGCTLCKDKNWETASANIP